MTAESAYGTSSGIATNPIHPGLIAIGGALANFDFTNAIRPREWVSIEQTNSGVSLSTDQEPNVDRPTPNNALAELRRLSGLTWEQLAQLFGVARRSLHFWASGKRLSANNEEKLYRLLSVAQAVDRGSPRTNRRLLVSALSSGDIPLDLLRDEQYEVVVQELGATEASRISPRPQLADAVLEARRPPRPEERVGALQDSVHRRPGGRRARRAARLKKK